MGIRTKETKNKTKDLVNSYLDNKNISERVAYLILVTIKNNNLFTGKECCHKLSETCCYIAEKEKEQRLVGDQLSLGLYFAQKTQDSSLKKKINELLGDYEYTNIIPFKKGDHNLLIPLQNKETYDKIRKYYKDAHNIEKYEQALIELKNNDKNIFIPTITNQISNNNKKEEDEFVFSYLDSYLDSILDGTTFDIIELLCLWKYRLN